MEPHPAVRRIRPVLVDALVARSARSDRAATGSTDRKDRLVESLAVMADRLDDDLSLDHPEVEEVVL